MTWADISATENSSPLFEDWILIIEFPPLLADYLSGIKLMFFMVFIVALGAELLTCDGGLSVGLAARLTGKYEL
jgi:hypothetical protein